MHHSAVRRGPTLVVTIAALFAVSTGSSLATPCAVSSATPLTFDVPAIDPRRPVDGRASFTVTCPLAQTVMISLLYSHRMQATAPGAALRYDLYTSPERTVVWGNGADGASLTRTFAGGQRTVVYVYARIPAQAAVMSGRFNDVIDIATLP